MDHQDKRTSSATQLLNPTESSEQSGPVATLQESTGKPMYTADGVMSTWNESIAYVPSLVPRPGYSALTSNHRGKWREQVTFFPSPPPSLLKLGSINHVTFVPKEYVTVEENNVSTYGQWPPRSHDQPTIDQDTTTYATPHQRNVGRIEVVVSPSAVPVTRDVIRSMVPDGSVKGFERWWFPVKVDFYPKESTEKSQE